MQNEMEVFSAEAKTKNGIDIKVCGICFCGHALEAAEAYKTGIEKTDFPQTADEYFLDLYLNRLIVSLSFKEIAAVGASIYVEGVNERSGGIIGNPFVEGESADDDVEYIGNGLYCAAFAGRFGAVFKADEVKARLVREKFLLLLNKESEIAVKLAEEFLDSVSDMYILVSDGSGKGGFHYVSAGCKRQSSSAEL